MKIVAGVSLKNPNPHVWDSKSPYYLPNLEAVMVSYADFHSMPGLRRQATTEGLRTCLSIPNHMELYLDNGAFRFSRLGQDVPHKEYETFVESASPDWCPIPQDYIPTPDMDDAEQLHCVNQTMEMNLSYSHNGYVPIIHVCRQLDEYLERFCADNQLKAKPIVALGGIVANLLRAPKAMSYTVLLDKIRKVRAEFSNQKLHVFGIGGTSTLHLAKQLKIDSVDSSGWRNRAARGLVQLPGIGDRSVAELGNWKPRSPNRREWERLEDCECPACKRFNLDGLKSNGLAGFCNRATHNLWTLLEENRKIQQHVSKDTYETWYKDHLYNSTYRPLIDKLVEMNKLLA